MKRKEEEEWEHAVLDKTVPRDLSLKTPLSMLLQNTRNLYSETRSTHFYSDLLPNTSYV